MYSLKGECLYKMNKLLRLRKCKVNKENKIKSKHIR